MTLEITRGEEADLDAIAQIYAPTVRTGTASFEEVPPSTQELAARRAVVVGAGAPYLIARERGRVLGFAYAGPFRPRPAYRGTLEDSVYVVGDARRCGVGARLLNALVDEASRAGFAQMIGIVGDPEVNAASVALHRRCGFRHAGRLEGVGVKFGRTLDIVLMQRALSG